MYSVRVSKAVGNKPRGAAEQMPRGVKAGVGAQRGCSVQRGLGGHRRDWWIQGLRALVTVHGWARMARMLRGRTVRGLVH